MLQLQPLCAMAADFVAHQTAWALENSQSTALIIAAAAAVAAVAGAGVDDTTIV